MKCLDIVFRSKINSFSKTFVLKLKFYRHEWAQTRLGLGLGLNANISLK
jgi:hypothetical protein